VALLAGKEKESPSKLIPLEPITRSRANTGNVYGRTSTQEENELREQLKSRLKTSQTLFIYQRSWVHHLFASLSCPFSPLALPLALASLPSSHLSCPSYHLPFLPLEPLSSHSPLASLPSPSFRPDLKSLRFPIFVNKMRSLTYNKLWALR
jgi:hypothetical protein